MSKRFYMFGALATLLVCAAALLGLFAPAGEGGVQRTLPAGRSITVVEHPEVRGWMDLAVSEVSPLLADAEDGDVWMLFTGGTLLGLDSGEGRWSTWELEGAGTARDMMVSDGGVLVLTGTGVAQLDPVADEVSTVPLPEGLDPECMMVRDGEMAVLSSDGRLAFGGIQDGFQVTEHETEELRPASALARLGPDWAFLTSDGRLALVDTSVDLWQLEDAAVDAPLVSRDGSLFASGDGSVMVRTSAGTWEESSSGRLYASGCVLTAGGVYDVTDPSSTVCSPPSFLPERLLPAEGGEDVMIAMDHDGMAVWGSLDGMETSLPYYEAERLTCSLAGQAADSVDATGTESMQEMIVSASGAFRIYESVSSRPDPFSEFPASGRDVRRELEDISIEEFRLVGITLDPTGGDQAMVEDGRGVSYVLYEGTELANNTHVADILSNEVVVIQDVIVDYSATGGGVTTIPTIYSMRLHEEGGL